MTSAAQSIYNRMGLNEKYQLRYASPDGLTWHVHNSFNTEMKMLNIPEDQRENVVLEILEKINKELVS